MGKTYFVLVRLYEFAKRQNTEIALVVNRRLLKEQLWEEIRRHDLKMNEREVRLRLFTYQELEGDGRKVERKKAILRGCQYIACDECHYFFSDSAFNPGVQNSFNFITSLYQHSILIFLSATLTPVRSQLEKRVWELHQDHVDRWEEKRKSYEEISFNNCLYRRNGEERPFASFARRNFEKEQSREYQERMRFYEEQMMAPRIREYQFLRDISANVAVWHFRCMEDILGMLRQRSSSEKWVVFVSSKKIGKEMRNLLIESGADETKAVYIDAEYDALCADEDPSRKYAKQEVENIVRNGRFQSDVLITTKVLDNGVSIKDKRVQNIVLMTDDKVEFQQMLGRKRFTKSDKKLNIYICVGNPGIFRRRAEIYYRIYWQICEKREIPLCLAQEMILNDPVTVSQLLQSYYLFDGCKYYGTELAIEEIRRKQLYCLEAAEKLMDDETFFLKEQLGWLGIEYTKEWERQANISVTQEETGSIQRKLQDLYTAGGIMDKERFYQFRKDILEVAAKIDKKNFMGKLGNLTTVQKALALREEWSAYQILAFGDKKKYYELSCGQATFYKLRVGLSYEKLKEIVEDCQNSDLNTIFRCLFEKDVPKCMIDDESSLIVFINDKLKQYRGLENRILKSSGKGDGKKIIVGKRPNSSKK